MLPVFFLTFFHISLPGKLQNRNIYTTFSKSLSNFNSNIEHQREMIMVTIKTSMGDIKLELFEKEAPKTVASFLRYVDEKHYNNTLFHRVINNFMIQGGGFDTDFNQKPTNEPVENEAANQISNETGTVAMARTSDPHSATSQFFINLVDNDFLDFKAPTVQGFGYCVFGKVSDGMDVVNKIAKVSTGFRGHHGDVPEEDVVIKEIVRD